MVVWNPCMKKASRGGKSMNSGRWRLHLRRKCHQIIISTLEMTGNLHTLLHSQATCTHRVHREDGYVDVPHGANWKKMHRGQENELAAQNHPTRHKRARGAPCRQNANTNQLVLSSSHGIYELLLQHTLLTKQELNFKMNSPVLGMLASH